MAEESWFTKARKALTANKKPQVKSLGTGYVGNAAEAAKKRNEELKKVAMDSYKKGGKVKKTGPAMMHKDEHVLTTGQVKKPEVKKLLTELATGKPGKRGAKHENKKSRK